MASTSHLFSLIGANANFRSQSVFFCDPIAQLIIHFTEWRNEIWEFPGKIYQVITALSRLEFPAMNQQQI